MKTLNLITLLLVIIGGLNWGLEALGYNLVEGIFGDDTAMTNIVYALVGLSAIWQIVPFFKATRTGEVVAESDKRTVTR